MVTGDEIAARADTRVWEPPVTNATVWSAEDADTGCIGVGRVEEAARGNLVYAVRAYYEDDYSTVQYLSAGARHTVKMGWRADEPSGSMLEQFLEGTD